MDRDPGMLVFSHCKVKVFCFELPEHCPSCRQHIESSLPPILPVRVPYPFVRAAQYPCSVVIKPTNGDFLNDYKSSSDLHIGVTSSRGRVIEYDRFGLHKDLTKSWDQCLVIYQEDPNELSFQHWDFTLEKMSEQDCWTVQRYNEETFNCYTFVLAFVKCLKNGDVSDAASKKTKFCEMFVLPRVTSAFKYITLYRRLKDSGYYVSKQMK